MDTGKPSNDVNECCTRVIFGNTNASQKSKVKLPVLIVDDIDYMALNY